MIFSVQLSVHQVVEISPIIFYQIFDFVKKVLLVYLKSKVFKSFQNYVATQVTIFNIDPGDFIEIFQHDLQQTHGFWV